MKCIMSIGKKCLETNCRYKDCTKRQPKKMKIKITCKKCGKTFLSELDLSGIPYRKTCKNCKEKNSRIEDKKRNKFLGGVFLGSKQNTI